MNWEHVIVVLQRHERIFQGDIKTAANAQQAAVYGTAALVIGVLAAALEKGLQK